eukprot:544041_1
MSSKPTVDSTSRGFANNPFLQSMGRKKSRKRATTLPENSGPPSDSTNKPKPKAKATPKPQSLTPRATSSTTSTTTAKESSTIITTTKSTKSRVRELSQSLANKNISYGQSRPQTKKLKAFKSANNSTAIPSWNKAKSDNSTFDKPNVERKRKGRTRKKINIDIDSDNDNKADDDKDEIIKELKLEIEELKKK